jgi:hypothetical protein
MTDTELLDKLQHMLDERYGISKLVSLDGHRANARQCIEMADPKLDGYRSPDEAARLIRMTFDETSGFEASVNYPGIILIAAEVAQMFRDGGAINVFEFQVNPPDMEPVVIRFQRWGGKTDMQLRSEALRELEAERAKSADLVTRLKALGVEV